MRPVASDVPSPERVPLLRNVRQLFRTNLLTTLRRVLYRGSMQSMSGNELKLTRLAMEVQAVELAQAMGKSRSSLSHIESRGRVKEATVKAYLDALATFGTVPIVTIERVA